MTKQQTELMLRYSPKPRSAYIKIVGGHAYGAATSTLLDKEDVWNLAYLSHDYEKKVEHNDPHFTTHVRRTCQMRLDGSGLGVGEPPSKLVGSLLALPAPRFVFLIRNHPTLRDLPLFVQYGQTWLDTIDARCRICQSGDVTEPEDMTATSQSVTYELLAKIMSRAK